MVYAPASNWASSKLRRLFIGQVELAYILTRSLEAQTGERAGERFTGGLSLSVGLGGRRR